MDLFDLFATGEILTTAQAGFVAGVGSEQIRKRCVQTQEEGRPIGIRIGGVWLVSKKRLIDDIEANLAKHGGPMLGKHGRLQAESRANKLPEMWASPPDTTEID